MPNKIKKRKKKLLRSNFLSHPTLSHSRFSKANFTIFIIIFAAIGGYVLLQSRAVAPMANVWVTPQGLANGTGSECVWHDIPVVVPADPTQACGDLQAANLVAPAAPPAGTAVLITGDSSTPYVPTGYTSNGADYTSGPPPSTGCSHTPGASNICMVENACRSITGNNHTAPLIFKPSPASNPVFTCQQILNTTYIQFADDDSGDLSTGPGNLRLGGLFTGGDHNSVTNVDITCQDSAPYPLTSGTQASSSTGPGANTTGQFCSAFIKGTMTNFTMTNGSIGPTYVDSCGTNGENASWDNSIGYSLSAAHIVFDHVDSHNPRFGINPVGGQVAGYTGGCTGNGGDGTTAAQAHAENFYLTDVTDVTIKNMYFKTCGNSTGVFVTRQSSKVDSHQSSQVNFINNIFQGSGAGTSCGVDLGYTNNALLAYNDFPSGGYIFCNGCDASLGNSATLVGNILYGNVCPQVDASWNFTFSHNLWMFNTASGGSASNCGGTANGDQAYNPSHNPGTDIWVNNSAEDFHLKAPPNPVIDKGDLADYPSTDKDGNARYQGAAPDIGAYEYVSPTSLVNVFVTTTGNDSTCVRGDQAKPCATLNRAAQISQCGDIIQVASGTYGSQTINESVTNSCATPVSFVCAGTPDSLPCIFTSSGSTVNIQSSNLSLDGFIFTSTSTGQSAKALSITTSSATPTSNITVKNSLMYSLTAGSTSCSGSTICTTGVIFVSGTSNVTFGPNDQVLGCCSMDGFDVYRDGTHNVGNSNFTFRNSKMLGIFDSCSRVSANMIANQPGCTGYGIGDGCSRSNCEHDDGFAVSDCQNCAWIDNSLYQAGSQQIFLQEFNGGVISNIDVIGNMIGGNGAPSSGGAGFNIGTFGSGAVTNYAGTFNFSYNTLIGVPFKVYTTDGGVDRWAAGSVMNLVGNLSEGDNAAYGGSGGFHFPGFNTVNSSGTNTGCSTNGSRLTLNYSYNWFYDIGPCTGPNNLNLRTSPKGVGFVSFVYPYNLHLSSSSDPAVDQAEAACSSATTDLDGNSRPQGTACDIGADEYVLAASTKPGDLNNDNKVNILDLSILLSHYGQTATSSQGDITGDGRVSILDLSILLSHYGS